MKKQKDKHMTSFNLDSSLYKDCRKKLLDNNLSFTEMIISCIHGYLSGSIDLQKFKIEISGSL